ncbi:Phosphomannomutase [Alkalispirochaeta americana]|uniref:Phosphomannomutase n=1 Tax=Alkalispirochaeta americana TaxID=159291 RepID=A0A1N6NYZ9_9SPIO|nr:hypothetical protein [Alkalispirochaeta americana]SIP97324.1 Phosphomannomutase [Alkalispirochaeta americana]
MNTINHHSSGQFSTSPERETILQQMVLSASGWRLCFGTDQDSSSPAISPAQRDLVILGATVFARHLKDHDPTRPLTVAIATDTRPTGPAIAEAAMRAFLAEGISLEWLGVCTTPEILAYTKQNDALRGFFYVTASHNPLGYNGFKFGLSDGAVLPGSAAWGLIDTFRALAPNQKEALPVLEQAMAVSRKVLAELDQAGPAHKEAARESYRRFALAVASGTPPGEEPESSLEQEFLVPLRRALAERPLGIVADLNGSARTTSVDRTLFPWLGARLVLQNDEPGMIRNQILPEGPGLAPAAQLLERHHRQDPAFQIGYAPDNDGDRGNLIFMDKTGKAVSLEAQEVFALVVTAELAWLHRKGEAPKRVCLVANGPTSSRIDEIADWFGATLFRAEVGEANVISLAREKQDQGWCVPVLGEGSNGGAIVPPATVRDPLSTVLAMMKFHAFSLERILAERCQITLPPGGPLLLSEVVNLLPRYTTIETDDPLAKMHVGSCSHKDLKARYESLVPRKIAPLERELAETLGVTTWEIWNYEGTRATRGPGNRTARETGGLRIAFLDDRGRTRASLWMRGSGTEPVFRILADCAGDNRPLAERMIRWQRALVQEAVET